MKLNGACSQHASCKLGIPSRFAAKRTWVTNAEFMQAGR